MTIAERRLKERLTTKMELMFESLVEHFIASKDSQRNNTDQERDTSCSTGEEQEGRHNEQAHRTAAKLRKGRKKARVSSSTGAV